MTLAPDSLRELERSLPDKPVTAEEAITAMIHHDGDTLMAAASLGCKPANIIAAIIQDQANADHLAAYLRSAAMIKAFETIGEMHRRVIDNLDNLNPRDLTKAYSSILELFSKYVEKGEPVTTGNPLEVVMKSLPPGIREAIGVLATSGSPVELK